MPDDLSRSFEVAMSRVKFNGNVEAAEQWLAWERARPRPTLWNHLVRLWRCLRKGRLPPEKRGYG